MNIGILTFHWATNYGAILQCWALQEALIELGHNVHVINYKPHKFDQSIWSFIRNRLFLTPKLYWRNLIKEKTLESFRNTHLRLTKRYKRWRDFDDNSYGFDVLISGSDQIMNPYFLFKGESNGSTAYFLDLKSNVIKIGYAVSFGTTNYPSNGILKVRSLIKQFDYVSAREETGLSILKSMGAENVRLAPDPTLLHKREFYEKIIENIDRKKKIRAYILRRRQNFIPNLSDTYELINEGRVEDWMASIRCSSQLITNSFHGVVFSLIFHIPFTVVLEIKENVGMNDRFYTLLSKLDLTNRIVSESDFNTDILTTTDFDWEIIDNLLDKYRKEGWDFLKLI